MKKLIGLIVIISIAFSIHWMFANAEKTRQKELDEIATFLSTTEMEDWNGAKAKRDATVYMNDSGAYVNFREKTYEAQVMLDGSVVLLENGKVVAQSQPSDTNKP